MVIYSIYKITNTINNKIYIGFTSNFELRKRKHLFDVVNGKCSYLHNAMRKHGINNFSWQIIYQSKDKEYTLNQLMELCSKLYEKGYNSLDIIRFIGDAASI